MKNRASTLIEVIISTAIFSMLAVVVFLVFKQGSKGYLDISTKNDIQTNAIKVSKLLQQNISRSHVNGISTSPRTCILSNGQKVHRDAIAVISLDDWNDSNNYDETTGKIKWNLYYLYYGTVTNNSKKPITYDDGQLKTLTINISPPTTTAKPYYIETLLNPSSDTLTSSISTYHNITLTNLLYKSEFTYNYPKVNIDIILKKDIPAFKEKNQKPTKMEIRLTIKPQNEI